MAGSEDAAKAARDELLLSLKSAYATYYAAEVKRIDSEAAFVRKVQVRTAALSLAKNNAAKARLLLVDDIGTFLTG